MNNFDKYNGKEQDSEEMWRLIMQQTGMSKRQYKQHLKTMAKKSKKRERK